jgi:poly-gamma-glutamate capsule biosynthesis protein CapA/YwtB (metallophosphatase superfamily)
MQEQKAPLTLVAVGDVSPNRDDPPSMFRYCRDILRAADFVFGHMEHPMTDKGSPTVKSGRVLSPRNITALNEQGAGFDVMSAACNHAMYHGREAFLDWLGTLTGNNIAVVGAGKNIAEARRPAILERGGTRVGFLGYLSIIVTDLVIAEKDLPGCAPLRASNYFQQVDPQPGTPPLIITELFPADKEAMIDDIRRLRSQVDVVVVSTHCGVHNIPETIAMYQKEAAYAAIDAGADLVLHLHAHILKGIEVYKGKVIFYGLGNFAAEHWMDSSGNALHSVKQIYQRDSYRPPTVTDYDEKQGYAAKLKHVHLQDGLKTMVVKACIQEGKIQKVTYMPACIRPTLEPEVVTRKDPKAQQVFDYVEKISASQDLKVRFSWEGDEVLISEDSSCGSPRRRM